MRVIAGEFRSRKLLSIPGLETRPTPDRMRETLFNILAGEIEGAVFVDAYAGTGSVGIEALSRGARRAVFIEHSRVAVETIRANLASLRCETRAQVIKGRAPEHLDRIDADIVFIDPPYDKEREYIAAFDSLETKTPALLVAQHSVRYSPQEECGSLRRVRTVKQGDNALSFYRPQN